MNAEERGERRKRAEPKSVYLGHMMNNHMTVIVFDGELSEEVILTDSLGGCFGQSPLLFVGSPFFTIDKEEHYGYF